MITVERTTTEAIEQEAARRGVTLPIEQTPTWMRYQATITDRSPWGGLVIRNGDRTAAVMSLVDFTTHGYHFLRSWHGPVWMDGRPDAELEGGVLLAVAREVHRLDGRQVFLRCGVWQEGDRTRPVLSSVPYDSTVVIDVTGGDDAILSRMKRRGRRDVRKSLRECPATCADETTQAMRSFAEYYDVMVETGRRDGFAPAPISDYAEMIEALGPEHCRVFAARVDGRVVAWSLVTLNSGRAVRYYAAMRTDAMRMHVTDRLLYAECCELGRQGVTAYDLMGIGSDFSPTLKGLNEFKTKFTEDVTAVAPDRDVPVRSGFYAALRTAGRIRGLLRRGR
ncbi:GNAT family N-acetyltransferase [uncultured Bifidobacterium sp.]|uniref:lipid II:glycine glycyltransferase FemX n=1 Tax=uncultured Bifidobacterium sp. TaxID=165187 RepID=UPI0028DB68A0|nr:GNAT family N-acetyltransferase [uncultured Bifidobacterium sp.]